MTDVDKYLAAYDAACSLELFVETIEGGYQPGAVLIEDAKAKLLRLASFERAGNEFFGRFSK